MYPEYCDGTRKEIIDLVQLIDEGLNNKLLDDKDTRIEELEEENVELKKQISNLLSCKDCPDNKGGYVCEKEYNDKCLTQKIQYIKELKEELKEVNKANEWHYVKDEDLPKDDENFICMLENGYKLECYYDPTTKRWYDNYFHHDIEYGYYQSKVIAWCEIPQF